MNKISLCTTVLFLSLGANSVWARSLRATADKLGQEASQIGFGLALFGLAIGAIYLIVGKQDGATKLTNTVLGIIILSAAPSIVNFIKSVT